MLAVKTVNGDAKDRVGPAFPLDHIILCLSEDAVLRAEEGSQPAPAVTSEDLGYVPEIRSDA
jgi:hypothetical protein